MDNNTKTKKYLLIQRRRVRRYIYAVQKHDPNWDLKKKLGMLLKIPRHQMSNDQKEQIIELKAALYKRETEKKLS